MYLYLQICRLALLIHLTVRYHMVTLYSLLCVLLRHIGQQEKDYFMYYLKTTLITKITDHVQVC